MKDTFGADKITRRIRFLNLGRLQSSWQVTIKQVFFQKAKIKPTRELSRVREQKIVDKGRVHFRQDK